MNGKAQIRLVALDMDGTITQHKTKLNEENKDVLQQIGRKYKAVIVGAGACRRIYEQLDGFCIDIIGHYGMQEARVITESGVPRLEIIKNLTVNVDRAMIEEKIKKLRFATGYTDYSGGNVEFHESGAITFPLLGTQAKLNDKLAFDPQRIKRRKIYDKVRSEFQEFTVFIGGTSSFDIVPQEFNKYIALKAYASQLGFNESNIIYFGDDYGIGGNDEHIYKSNIQFVRVDNYLKFPEYAKAIL